VGCRITIKVDLEERKEVSFSKGKGNISKGKKFYINTELIVIRQQMQNYINGVVSLVWYITQLLVQLYHGGIMVLEE
jgi:hypothetical protein